MKEEARKRQEATQLKGRNLDGTPRTSVLQNSVKPNTEDTPLFPAAPSETPKPIELTTPVHTDEELGKVAGISRDTIQKARTIAQKAPEPVKEQLRKGEHFKCLPSRALWIRQ